MNVLPKKGFIFLVKSFFCILLSLTLILNSFGTGQNNAYAITVDPTEGKPAYPAQPVLDEGPKYPNNPAIVRVQALNMISEKKDELTLKSGKKLEVRGMYPLTKEMLENNNKLDENYYPYYMCILRDADGKITCFEDGDIYEGNYVFNLENGNAIKNVSGIFSYIVKSIAGFIIAAAGGALTFGSITAIVVGIVDFVFGPIAWAIGGLALIVSGFALVWDSWTDYCQQHKVSRLGRENGNMVVDYEGCPQADHGMELTYCYVDFTDNEIMQCSYEWSDESCDFIIENTADVKHLGKSCINVIKVRADCCYDFDEMDQKFLPAYLTSLMFGIVSKIASDKKGNCLNMEKKVNYRDYIDKLNEYYNKAIKWNNKDLEYKDWVLWEELSREEQNGLTGSKLLLDQAAHELE